MKQQTLEMVEPDLFSSIRRHINALKQKQVATRRQAINQLLAIIRNDEQLAPVVARLPFFYDEVMMMANKDILKCLSDSSQYNREHALYIIAELIQRCHNITPFLPYIFAVLIDRTNCNDLQGIANLPEKMRPAPGQKPKVISKLIEPCEQIRLQFCLLLKTIFVLVKQSQIRDKLDEVVNILRALIMDPSPQIQKNACETLLVFCEYFKAILLHYTEIMGRAVLLPLVSKKSKIRVAGLRALTAVLRCGIWKYNAFVFQNLVGFRDPNSVPIKDFYEASNNINYLATFVNDSNVKVREEFIAHVKIWTCDLEDKYDHHGRLVPYILSGFFDSDENVRNTAMSAIVQIGRQIEQEKEKEFRQNRQYAIDAAWTWEGRLVDLAVIEPIKSRPSLGSRVFVRGHVRKFWFALYKQIKDINYDNRIRACYLMLYGTIYTENYMTQYLDVMIPHILSSIIPHSLEDRPISNLLEKTIFYLGRYCEVSAYLHIMTSALKGQLVQNQEFLKAALKGLARLIEGSFDSIPIGTGLCHKRIQIDQLITIIDQCSMCSQIYRENSSQGLQVVMAILNGLKAKATREQSLQIMQKHSLSIMKLLAVSYYEHCYSFVAGKEVAVPERQQYASLVERFQLVAQLYPSYFSILEDYMREAYMNPPSLMDADWKLVIVIHNLLSQSSTQDQSLIFQLSQQVISESLSLNRSVQILNFIFKYVIYLFAQIPEKSKLSKLHLVITKSLQNLSIFKPIKKVPVYDQHLQKPQTDPNVITLTEDVFVPLFVNCSEAIQGFYANKIHVLPADLGKIIHNYIKLFNKFSRDKTILLEGVKTLWIVFQRAELDEQSPSLMTYQKEKDRIVVFEDVIDWLMERLETLGQPDHQKLTMLFHTFGQVVQCCPKITNVVTKLPNFYPNYPVLLQKLFKYAMDEKDLQTKDKYRDLLMQLCGKMRPWFELQARLSQQGSRFARTALLKAILDKAK